MKKVSKLSVQYFATSISILVLDDPTRKGKKKENCFWKHPELKICNNLMRIYCTVFFLL